MATVAESAVLVSSAAAAKAVTRLQQVQGPSSDFHRAEHVLKCYPVMGFQATNYGRACRIAERMLRRQAPSKVYQIKDGKYVLVRHDDHSDDDGDGVRGEEEEAGDRHSRPRRDDHVYPNIFLGVTANLFGTGCREAVRFLVQEGVVPRPTTAPANGGGGEGGRGGGVDTAVPEDASEDQLMFARLKREYREQHGTAAFPDETPSAFRSFLCAVVVSGGGVEHDVRRACAPYTVSHYASEGGAASSARGKPQHSTAQAQEDGAVAYGAKTEARFGNVTYPAEGSADAALFDTVMQLFVSRLRERQQRLHAAAAALPIPEKYLDVCSWSVTPSEAWALLGLWLVDLLTEALHRHQHVSTVHDGATTDTTDEAAGAAAGGGEAAAGKTVCAACRAESLRRARGTVVYWAAQQQVPLFSPSFTDGDISTYLLLPAPTTASAGSEPLVQLDLVRDIHAINKLAMHSKKTGMLICGGGVVKHHVCNANLMRNGADYTIILNNGQEFDGSDAGAKPEEALSWGKVRMEGEFVKVYGEITTYLPLLVAQVFVPAVRRRDRPQREKKEMMPKSDTAGVMGGGGVVADGQESSAAVPGKEGEGKGGARRHRRRRGRKAPSEQMPSDAAAAGGIAGC